MLTSMQHGKRSISWPLKNKRTYKLNSHIIRYIAIGCLLQFSAMAFADGWEYRLTPYLWFAGLEGDVGGFPGLPSAPVDISPNDALNDTEASFMVMFDAKKNGHGLFLDFLYSDVQSDEDVIPQVDLTARSITKTTMVTAAYEYTFYQEKGTVLDFLAGARYWNVDSTFKFKGGLGILDGKKIQHDESWVDPYIGVKGWAPLGDSKFYVAGGGGAGGFGVGSDLFYELSANIGYQWNKSIGTALGYRVFEVDYDNDGFLYDAKQAGWQLGLTWAF